MNLRGVAAVAVTVILAVAIFSAVYFSRQNGNNSSGFSISEFTGRGTSTWGYNSVVYSKLTMNGDTPTAWVLEAQVDYVDSSTNTAYRHVYKNGFIYHGAVEANGFFNISDCGIVNQDRMLGNSGNYHFVPVEVTGEDRAAETTRCATCTRWRLSVGGQDFIMEADGGTPKFFYSRDQVIEVSQFEYGVKSWSSPAIDSSYDALCSGSANASDPQADSPALKYLRQASPLFVNEAPENAVASKDWRVMSAEFHAKYRGAATLDVGLKHDNQLQGSCPSSWKGDGWCDSACNNAENGWDNGDCCAGTCTSGRTYPCGTRAPYNCLNAGRTCLFLHGVGMQGDNTFRDSNIADSCSTGRCFYWGDVQRELSGICTRVIYGLADTNQRGWNNQALQNFYYDKANEVQRGGGLVFAHSMGNMILGAACMYQNKCNVKWIGLGGPIRGSRAANYVELARAVLGSGAYGPAYNQLKRSVEGLAEAGSRRDGLIATIRNNGLYRGVACGIAGWGGGGVAGAALAAIKAVAYGLLQCTRRGWFNICIGWGNVPADGMVHTDECGWSLSSNWRNTNFEYDGNHNDLTGNKGNYNNFYDWLRWIASRS